MRDIPLASYVSLGSKPHTTVLFSAAYAYIYSDKGGIYMQAEHRRGNGFIVSPLSVPFTVDRPKKKLKPIKTLYMGEYIKDIFSQIFGEWTYVRKNALKTVVSVSAVTGCAIFFCKRLVPDDNLNVGAQGVPEFEESHLPYFFPA